MRRHLQEDHEEDDEEQEDQQEDQEEALAARRPDLEEVPDLRRRDGPAQDQAEVDCLPEA